MKLIYPKEFKIGDKVLNQKMKCVFGHSTGGIYIHINDNFKFCIDSPFRSDDEQVIKCLDKFIEYLKEEIRYE